MAAKWFDHWTTWAGLYKIEIFALHRRHHCFNSYFPGEPALASFPSVFFPTFPGENPSGKVTRVDFAGDTITSVKAPKETQSTNLNQG